MEAIGGKSIAGAAGQASTENINCIIKLTSSRVFSSYGIVFAARIVLRFRQKDLTDFTKTYNHTSGETENLIL